MLFTIHRAAVRQRARKLQRIGTTTHHQAKPTFVLKTAEVDGRIVFNCVRVARRILLILVTLLLSAIIKASSESSKRGSKSDKLRLRQPFARTLTLITLRMLRPSSSTGVVLLQRGGCEGGTAGKGYIGIYMLSVRMSIYDSA
jgi:hypothetical protein